MLRRILNLIVILVIIVAISGIFINLYNSGKKESNKFDTVKEKVKENASKVKDNIKKQKEKIIDSDNNSNNESTESKKDTEESDVNTSEVSSNSSNISEDSSSVAGSEIAVSSTGTKENIILSLVGGVVILSGAGLVIYRTNKYRA